MDDDELLQDLFNELTDDSEIDSEPEKTIAPQLMVDLRQDESVEEATARVALTSEYHAADSIWVLNQITAFKEANITNLAKRLESQTQQLNDGDLGQAESMLAAQAYTLESLFHNLLRRAAMNVRNDFNVVERLMKLALKAQSQCRTTLDSLASMKKPPPELIKQFNTGQYQQVNNFSEKQNRPNELLEKTDGERLDFGKAQETVRVDSRMEAVGEKLRPKDKKGQE